MFVLLRWEIIYVFVHKLLSHFSAPSPDLHKLFWGPALDTASSLKPGWHQLKRLHRNKWNTILKPRDCAPTIAPNRWFLHTQKSYIRNYTWHMLMVDFYRLQLSFRSILYRQIILGILKYQTVIVTIHPILLQLLHFLLRMQRALYHWHLSTVLIWCRLKCLNRIHCSWFKKAGYLFLPWRRLTRQICIPSCALVPCQHDRWW